MTQPLANPRHPEVEVDPMFPDRWSPRAYRSEPIAPAHLAALFEAARWAPSCFNEQPWVFCYATTDADRHRFATPLIEKNRQWASNAPVLLYVLARRHFQRNDNPNRTAAFDAGAAWMSLALQARKFGMYAHAMAGFDLPTAYDVLAADPDRYEIIAAVAVGYRAAPDTLPEDVAAREVPSPRKTLSEIAVEGRAPKE